MWNYSQSTGKLFAPGNALFATCYAGNGQGLNNPAAQVVHDVGPLPQGRYTMTALLDQDGTDPTPPRTGRATIVLTPDPANEMFGRSGFRIHGDNLAGNHTASDGCIICAGIANRIAIWNSGDHDLLVTE